MLFKMLALITRKNVELNIEIKIANAENILHAGQLWKGERRDLNLTLFHF